MIIIVLALFNLVYAQDIEPASMSFTYKGQVININQDRFKQNKFLMGWQWSGTNENGYKMNYSMGSNIVAGGGFPVSSWNTLDRTHQLLSQPGKDGIAWNRPFIQTAAWLTYEPGLVIPEDESFRTITDDPTNPIFGFKYVTEYGTLTFTQDDDDFNKKHYRLALYQDDFYSSTQTPELVLSNPWPNDELYTKNEGGQHTLYTGKKWYLTINLRRTSSSFNGYSSTIMDDTPVLSIVLPYEYDYLGYASETGGPGTEQIKFYEVPESNLNNISNWYSDFIPDRPIGQYIPLATASITNPMSRTLTITNSMIPNWLDNSNEPVDINIVASFLTNSNSFGPNAFDDTSTTYNNPKYTSAEVSNTFQPFITSQGIDIYYHKTLDVAIDYIRIGNDISQDLLTGKFESGTYINTFLPYGINPLAYNPHRYNVLAFGFDNIYESIQGFLTTIASSSYTLPNSEQRYEFFRFYGEDTESPNPIFWGMLRYWNLITDGVTITRDSPNLGQHYNHYTKAPNRYLGIQMYHSESDMYSPFLRGSSTNCYDNNTIIEGGYWLKGFDIKKKLNTKNTQTPYTVDDIDYFGFNNGGLRDPHDSVNSDYETGHRYDVYNMSGRLNIYDNAKELKYYNSQSPFSNYQDFLSGIGGTSANNMLKWDFSINGTYDTGKFVLYNYSKNWWMNFFISSIFEDVNPSTTFTHNRFKENFPDPNSAEDVIPITTYENKRLKISVLKPKTSEEVRRLIGTSLILGAKGILLDKSDKDEDLTSFGDNWIDAGLANTNAYSSTISPSNEWEYLRQIGIGGDFTNPSSTTTVLGDVHNIYKYIDPEVVKRQMKVKEDRVYFGLRSTRIEVKKQFEWIKLNEDELLNLDLLSWYVRSFFERESHNPYFGNISKNTYGNRFFDLKNIRTKKIYQPSLDFNHDYDPPLEPLDSSFFDITILKSKATPIHLLHSSNTFYVGVQNRRTDPLFLNSKASTTFQEVQFYSGAEFDDKVLNGGYDLYDQYHSSTWWDARWWERFGARELIMPINLKPYGYGKFITFTDLGYDKYDDDPDNWFLTEPYNHVIDTILNHSNSLRVKLLPGQFKIIKAVQKTVLPDDEDCYTCDLVDDFDAFNLELKPVGTSPNCCWDVNFIVDYTKLPLDKLGCTFTDVPIKITLDGDDYQTLNPTFSGATYTTGVSSKSIYLSKTFSGSGTFTMGQLCYPPLPPMPPNSRKTRVSVLFGKDTLGSFIGCNRRIFDDVLCESGEEEEVESCCDKLGDVSSTFYLPDNQNNEVNYNNICCTKIMIDTDTDADCIYNVALELSKNYLYNLSDNTNSMTFSNLPLENSKYYLGMYCSQVNLSVNCEGVTPIQRDLLFLGADGETICRKPVTIYSCCESINVEQGPEFKINFEEDKDTEPFISLEKESIDVKVIPNPNTGVFRIELTNKLEGQYEINIHDALGNKILGFSPAIYDVGIFVKYVNIQNYPNGAYFINIRGNKENITIPVVISK